MDQERKYTEGVPLNSENMASGNVYVNSKKATKINASNGAVIHCKIDRVNPKDVGLHINTTLAVTSSKKLKLLFTLVFILCIISLIVSCILAVYFCNQMISIKSQLEIVKTQLIYQNNLDTDDIENSLLVMERNKINSRRNPVNYDDEEYRFRERKSGETRSPPLYFNNYPRADAYIPNVSERRAVDALGSKESVTHNDEKSKDIILAHYIGAYPEIHLKDNDMRIGPWVLDHNVSHNSANQLELSKLDYKTILVKESGIYFIYAQLVYFSSNPNVYNVWARSDPAAPRLLASCANLGVVGALHLPSQGARPPVVSCGTQSVVHLNAGDELSIVQRENNVTVSLREGYTYFGLYKLH